MYQEKKASNPRAAEYVKFVDELVKVIK